MLNPIRYCIRCCAPSTMEGVIFDSAGFCLGCVSSEKKMHIDWSERFKELKKIVEIYKKKSGNNYDCILPISGGKDSFFQAHILTKVLNVKPLAVTFNHNWYSETGFYNLQRCLQVFELDHIQFTPSRTLVNKLAKKSLSAIGDSCWHCHMGVGSFPLQIAIKFNIPLIIWGESIHESSNRSSYSTKNINNVFNKEYFLKQSAKKNISEMIDDKISHKDIFLFNLPTSEDYKNNNIFGLHLGDFIFWDDEKQTEWIKKYYGWKETEMEGTYKRYKSAECIMSGMHDFTCYLKRGFGRATWQVIMDVRRGIVTREEGFKLIREYDSQKPEVLDYYLKITNLSEDDFFKIMKENKLDEIKDLDLKIKKKSRINEERLYPFVEQIIDKHLKK